jgi:hypothetical protein
VTSAVSTIITRAYRVSNIIPRVASTDTNQDNEALDILNPLILSVVGYEAGRELADLNIGGEWDQANICSQWIPENVRLILNLSAAESLDLHPQPYNGQRLAVADAGNNLATYNLTLDGNGRTIEGAATLTLSTGGMARQWLYDAASANWVKITALTTADSMPFPQDFDRYFVNMLAMELNPSYGQSLSPESTAAMRRAESILKARYRRPRDAQELPTLGLLGQRNGGFDQSTASFSAGRPRL